MDDLEICKRIAEIEGVIGHEYQGSFVPSNKFGMAVNDSKDNIYSYSVDDYSYNPLIDDALCFKLMVKYEIQLTYYPSVIVNPNRAICLAIIEANK